MPSYSHVSQRHQQPVRSVGPERYREIKARVAELPLLPWHEVVEATTSGPRPLLSEYLRRTIEANASADERLATVYPVLRRADALSAVFYANNF